MSKFAPKRPDGKAPYVRTELWDLAGVPVRFIHSPDGHREPTIFAYYPAGEDEEGIYAPVIRRIDLAPNVSHLWPRLVDLIVKDEADR